MHLRGLPSQKPATKIKAGYGHRFANASSLTKTTTYLQVLHIRVVCKALDWFARRIRGILGTAAKCQVWSCCNAFPSCRAPKRPSDSHKIRRRTWFSAKIWAYLGWIRWIARSQFSRSFWSSQVAVQQWRPGYFGTKIHWQPWRWGLGIWTRTASCCFLCYLYPFAFLLGPPSCFFLGELVEI